VRLLLTEPVPIGPPPGTSQAVFIFQERIESVTPSLVVLVYVSNGTIPRNSAVTVTSKVTLPGGEGIPGMLPQLYIYDANDNTVLKQTMNPTGDPTLFQLSYFIQPTAPVGDWNIEVVSAIGNLALDTGSVPGFVVT
jgi:hypothetical protein